MPTTTLPTRPVLIERLELDPPHEGNQAHVRATVALGHLLPSDVEVELAFDCGADPAVPSASPPHRMWSECPIGDGIYKFAALIRQDELDSASRLHVRARASRDPARSESLASATLILPKG